MADEALVLSRLIFGKPIERLAADESADLRYLLTSMLPTSSRTNVLPPSSRRRAGMRPFTDDRSGLSREDHRRRAGEADRVIGQRIRAHRKIAGLTQTHVARAVGVTYQQIQKYEKGINRTPPERLSQIAATLGITLDELTEDVPLSVCMKPAELIAAMKLPGAADLLAYYSKIGKPTTRRKALELVQQLSEGPASPSENSRPSLGGRRAHG